MMMTSCHHTHAHTHLIYGSIIITDMDSEREERANTFGNVNMAKLNQFIKLRNQNSAVLFATL